MPNWCFNKLIVKSNGHESEFREFMNLGRNKEKINGKEEIVWRISNYFPTPQRLLEKNLTDIEKKELIKIYGFDNWYDWRSFNWGVKWDINDIGFEWSSDEKSFYILDFDSAWSPPIQFLTKVSMLFPLLSFQLEFFEPAMLISGVVYINNGLFLELFSEPVYKNSLGEIIDVEYDPDDEIYSLSTGEKFNIDEWSEQQLYFESNPFEDLIFIN